MKFDGSYAFFFNFSSICHVIQWEFYIISGGHATLLEALSVRRAVHRSVHPLVHGHESKSAEMSVLDGFWAAAPKL